MKEIDNDKSQTIDRVDAILIEVEDCFDEIDTMELDQEFIENQREPRDRKNNYLALFGILLVSVILLLKLLFHIHPALFSVLFLAGISAMYISAFRMITWTNKDWKEFLEHSERVHQMLDSNDEKLALASKLVKEYFI